MVNSCLLVFLLLVSCACVSAYLPKFLFGRPIDGFVKPPDLSHLNRTELLQVLKDLPDEKWFNQVLDHFNPTDTRRWKQRYFVSGPTESNILFVMIGGEGAASPFFNTQSMFASYAKKYGAICMQLEHRFYGKSHPLENMTTENLRYLSSKQALSDLALFITAQKQKYSAQKVIVFGGSYSGALAAWFRLKYPHLADGAVSSSAPILAQVNFTGYLEVVKNSLNTFEPVGSCNSAIAAATKAMKIKLETAKGRQELKDMFNLCDDIDVNKKNDVANLFLILASNIMGIVQYNNESSGRPNIHEVCSIMTNKSIGTELQRYAQVAHSDRLFCIYFSYKKMIEVLQQTEFSSAAGVGVRQWIFQTCTEFGYYQSSDSPNQPFGHMFPITFLTQKCADIFGPAFNEKYISSAVSVTNTDYGALNYTENRVVFVNGDIDPWHYLSITYKIPQDAVIYIHGTAHCANMYLPSPSDPPGLKNAREEIEKLIGQWLHSSDF